MNNAAQVARTNQILRERIALGLTSGGARRKKAGSKVHKRKRTNRKCISDKTGRKRVRKSAYRCPPKSHVARKGAGIYEDMYGGCGDNCDECPMCDGAGVLIGGLDGMMPSPMHAGVLVGGRRRVRSPRSPKRRVRGRGDGVMAGARKKRSGSKSRRSPWVDFVKKWAQQHRVSYSQALREHGQEVSRAYHKM